MNRDFEILFFVTSYREIFLFHTYESVFGHVIIFLDIHNKEMPKTMWLEYLICNFYSNFSELYFHFNKISTLFIIMIRLQRIAHTTSNNFLSYEYKHLKTKTSVGLQKNTSKPKPASGFRKILTIPISLEEKHARLHKKFVWVFCHNFLKFLVILCLADSKDVNYFRAFILQKF
jgi:hypothetical protein